MPAGKLLVVQFRMNKPPGGTAPPANQPDPALGPAAFIYIVISIAYILSGLFCPARATDNTIDLGVTNTAKLALLATATAKLGANAGLTLSGTGVQINALPATSLAKATVFNVTSANVADAKKITALSNFSAATSTLKIADTAAVIAVAANAALLAAASEVKLNAAADLKVDQAKILAGLGSRFVTGSAFSMGASAADLVAIATLSSAFFGKKSTGTISVTGTANVLSYADYQKIASSIAALSGGATLTVSDTLANLITFRGTNTAIGAGSVRASAIQLTGTNTLTAAEAAKLLALTGADAAKFSLATGATMAISGTYSAISGIATAFVNKATSLAVTNVLINNVDEVVGYTSFSKTSTMAVSDTAGHFLSYLNGANATTNSNNATSLKSATSIEITGRPSPM